MARAGPMPAAVRVEWGPAACTLEVSSAVHLVGTVASFTGIHSSSVSANSLLIKLYIFATR